MKLDQYRLKTATRNRHRLWLCLAIAAVVHLGVWRIGRMQLPRPKSHASPVLIQFVVIDPSPLATPPPTQVLAQFDSTFDSTAAQPSPIAPEDVSTAPKTPRVAAKKDEVWGEYLMVLRQQINQQPVGAKGDLPAKVRFVIDRQGQLLTVELLQSSGNKMADQAAVNAVQWAAPFAPLPVQSQQDHLRVTFTFDEAVE